MFKKYSFYYQKKDGHKTSVDFVVNSRKSKSGFFHRACVIGFLPRLDDVTGDWESYINNDGILMKKSYCRQSYYNRTWEAWLGQSCLSKLWRQLAELKFLDLGRISAENPFNNNKEPEHQDMWDPDELFSPFLNARKNQ